MRSHFYGMVLNRLCACHWHNRFLFLLWHVFCIIFKTLLSADRTIGIQSLITKMEQMETVSCKHSLSVCYSTKYKEDAALDVVLKDLQMSSICFDI